MWCTFDPSSCLHIPALSTVSLCVQLLHDQVWVVQCYHVCVFVCSCSMTRCVCLCVYSCSTTRSVCVFVCVQLLHDHVCVFVFVQLLHDHVCVFVCVCSCSMTMCVSLCVQLLHDHVCVFVCSCFMTMCVSLCVQLLHDQVCVFVCSCSMTRWGWCSLTSTSSSSCRPSVVPAPATWVCRLYPLSLATHIATGQCCVCVVTESPLSPLSGVPHRNWSVLGLCHDRISPLPTVWCPTSQPVSAVSVS